MMNSPRIRCFLEAVNESGGNARKMLLMNGMPLLAVEVPDQDAPIVLACVLCRQPHWRRCSRDLHRSGTLTKMISLPTACVQEVDASCRGGGRKGTKRKSVFNTRLRG